MDLFAYSLKRLNAGGLERASFLNQFTKRVIKSMSRSTATRIHLNRWLVQIKTMQLTINNTAFIEEMRDHCGAALKRSPLGAKRLMFMLDLIVAINHPRTIAECIANWEHQLSNDQEFHKGVAHRYGIHKLDCGHWHKEVRVLYGNEEDIHARSNICVDCSDSFLSDDIRFISSYDGGLYLMSRRTEAFDRHGGEVAIDNRHPHFRHNEVRGFYHHVDWSPHTNLIADYHSSKRKGFKLIESPWFKSNRRAFGCELEIQVQHGSADAAAGRVHDALNPSGKVGEYCFFERDGSIGKGFELITQPAGLDVHAAKFATFLQDKDMKQGMRSHEGGACGFHVHVGRDYLTQGQIYRIQSFLNDVRNEHLIKKIARRYQSGYSKFKPDMAKFSPHGKATGDRYEALNVTSDKTIEFRLFRGSLRYESIMAALEFVNAVLDFCTPGNTSFVDFNALGFKKFLMHPSNSADTKYLRSYLSINVDHDNEQRQAA
jgi:hypothetical protein